MIGEKCRIDSSVQSGRDDLTLSSSKFVVPAYRLISGHPSPRDSIDLRISVEAESFPSEASVLILISNDCSARSKVKGHLQLYHAYIPNGNELADGGGDNSSAADGNSSSAAPSSEPVPNQDPEPGWEMVDATTDSGAGASNGQAQVEQPARVLLAVIQTVF